MYKLNRDENAFISQSEEADANFDLSDMSLYALIDMYAESVGEMYREYDTAPSHSQFDVQEILMVLDVIMEQVDELPSEIVQYLLDSKDFLLMTVESLDAPEGVRALAQAYEYAHKARAILQASASAGDADSYDELDEFEGEYEEYITGMWDEDEDEYEDEYE